MDVRLSSEQVALAESVAQAVDPVEPAAKLGQPLDIVPGGPDHHQVIVLPGDRRIPPDAVVEVDTAGGEGLVVQSAIDVVVLHDDPSGGGEGDPHVGRAPVTETTASAPSGAGRAA